MSKIARFVIWICSKFTKREIEQIVAGLIDILQDCNPEVKPKDDFQEKHPHYRDFSVEALDPLTNYETAARQARADTAPWLANLDGRINYG